MLKKIISFASLPMMAVPLLYLESGSALGASLTYQQQLSLEFSSPKTSSHSLLLSSAYDKDRDYHRECSRKYQDAYRKIDQDRRNLYNDDNDRDRWRHRRDLERDMGKLQELRDKYPNCDYHQNGRDYRDRDFNRNDSRDYRDREYDRDNSPITVPLERPIR